MTERLHRLVEAEIFHKERYQEKPDRFEYRLTSKGLDLYPIIMTLVRWGDVWHDDGHGVPVRHIHNSCSHQSQANTVCSHCAAPLDPRETHIELREEGQPYWLPQKD